jgi:glycosyltransferase involved in cell wall biosynthesis
MSGLSVIIPTLNEADFLPVLLDALNRQTDRPDQVIVADAGSTDGTVELARASGAVVVPGGMPAAGRNAGARAATCDLFQFFDADVTPPPEFVEQSVDEFTRGGYAVATCLLDAPGQDLADQIIVEATNLYLQIVQPISPRAPGFCILARRAVHEAIGGFDESLKLSEDHDYVRRASQFGEFGILTGVRIPVSMRRLEKEGVTRLALKYLWCEMYALAGQPIRSMPFEYEFGKHSPAPRRRGHPLVDIAELRVQLGRFENPIQRLSRRGQDQFQRLVESDPTDATRVRFPLFLGRSDLDTLDRYLRRRLSVVRDNSRSLQARWLKLKTWPRESIRLLEPGWLRSKRKPDDRNA